MLHYVKSHKYKSVIFFTASINSFYYFPFLQSAGDTSVLLIEKEKSYIFAPRARHFERSMPKIPFLTTKHQEKLTAGMYKCQKFRKCSELVAVDCPTRVVSWGVGGVMIPLQSG